MKFPLSKLRPNPFRDLEFNGYDTETIDGLMASIEETGFWANVTGRPADSGVEIAYGHHRIEAARRLHGDDFEVEIAVAELDDRMMLKMMIAENINQRGNAVANEFETARGLVRGLADGRLELAVPESVKPESVKNGELRYAPSFAPPKPGETPSGPAYTFDTVASFFGWDTRKARTVFGALELDELGILPIEELMGMGTSAVRQLVEATRSRLDAATKAQEAEDERIEELEAKVQAAEEESPPAEVEAELEAARAAKREHVSRANRDIRETATAIKEKLENKEITTRAIKDVAREIELKNADESYTPPPAAVRVLGPQRRRCDTFFEGKAGREFGEVVAAAEEIAASSRREDLEALVFSLKALSRRAAEVAAHLEGVLDTPAEAAPEPVSAELF